MDSVLLVTGGSRGIGAAVAELAASRGYSVAVNYREGRGAAEEVVDRIRARGGRAESFQADVASREAVREMFKAVDQKLGTVAALINNAGVLEHQCRVAEVTPERLARIFEVNVFGTIYCSQEAVERMSTARGGKGGAIVNVSSVAARLGAAGEYVDYAASKGAVDSFTIGLAQEVAQEGIRVNAVRPGFIRTEIHARGGEPGRIDRIKNSIPLRRGGEPEEVAKSILWLLSPEASYITGGFIEVAGGK